jgi:hypothetical protein
VDGAPLFDEIAELIGAYNDMPPGGLDLVALIPGTSFALYRAEFDYAPRFIIMGEKGSGKSNLMKMLAELCQRPFMSSDITKAPLFRTIDQYKPTVLIDEAHENLRHHEDLVTVLHSGWDYHTAYTTRMDGRSERTFCTFAIAVLAGVGEFAGAELLSRAFIWEMIESRRNIPKFYPQRHTVLTTNIRRKLLRWSLDNRVAMMECEPELPPVVSKNRVADIARTMLKVADVAGGHWPQRARESISIIAADVPIDDDNIGRLLLESVHEIVNDRDLTIGYHHPDNKEWRTEPRIAAETSFFWSIELVTLLSQRPDLPFQKLTPNAMARTLRGYRSAKLHPVQKMIGGRGTPNWRGYHRKELERAFSIYGVGQPSPVEAEETATPLDATPEPISAAAPQKVETPLAASPEPTAIPLDATPEPQAAPEIPSNGQADIAATPEPAAEQVKRRRGRPRKNKVAEARAEAAEPPKDAAPTTEPQEPPVASQAAAEATAQPTPEPPASDETDSLEKVELPGCEPLIPVSPKGRAKAKRILDDIIRHMAAGNLASTETRFWCQDFFVVEKHGRHWLYRLDDPHAPYPINGPITTDKSASSVSFGEHTFPVTDFTTWAAGVESYHRLYLNKARPQA